MDKKFRLACILSLVLAGLAIAWNTLTLFFSGVGVNFVAALALFGILFVLVIEDKELYNRTRDLFYTDLTVVCCELLVFVMVEYFGRFGKVFYIFTVVQKLLSVFAILFFAYIILKMLFVQQGKTKNVFACLFTRNTNKKAKKKKELANGSLSDKPKSSTEETPVLEGQIELEEDGQDDEL